MGNPQNLQSLLSKIHTAGGSQHHVALLRSIQGHRGALVILQRGQLTSLPGRLQTPLVVLICDDDDTPSGPKGWNAELLGEHLRDAPIVMLHAAAADPTHYALVAGFSSLFGKAVLIETTHHFVRTWIDLLRNIAPLANVICVVPPGVREQAQQRGTDR